MLDDQGNVKLIDFGLSAQCSPSGFLHSLCGTPAYAAPEVLLGQAYRGPAVDVWSLGVLLYAMVCAAFPFAQPQETVEGLFTDPSHATAGTLVEWLERGVNMPLAG